MLRPYMFLELDEEFFAVFDVGFIGLIQAFIFMLLTIIYFGLAREGLEAEHSH